MLRREVSEGDVEAIAQLKRLPVVIEEQVAFGAVLRRTVLERRLDLFPEYWAYNMFVD